LENSFIINFNNSKLRSWTSNFMLPIAFYYVKFNNCREIAQSVYDVLLQTINLFHRPEGKMSLYEQKVSKKDKYMEICGGSVIFNVPDVDSTS